MIFEAISYAPRASMPKFSHMHRKINNIYHEMLLKHHFCARKSAIKAQRYIAMRDAAIPAFSHASELKTLPQHTRFTTYFSDIL